MRAELRVRFWLGRLGSYSGRFARFGIDFEQGAGLLHDKVLARLMSLASVQNEADEPGNKRKLRVAVGLSGLAGANLLEALVELFAEFGSELVLLPSSINELIRELRMSKASLPEGELERYQQSLLHFSIATYQAKELTYFYDKIEDSLAAAKDGDAVYYLYDLILKLSSFDGLSCEQTRKMIKAAFKRIDQLAKRIEVLDVSRIYAEEMIHVESLKRLAFIFLHLHDSPAHRLREYTHNDDYFHEPYVFLCVVLEGNQTLRGVILPPKGARFSHSPLVVLLDSLRLNRDIKLESLLLDDYGKLSIGEYDFLLSYARCNRHLRSLGRPVFHQGAAVDLQRACQVSAILDRHATVRAKSCVDAQRGVRQFGLWPEVKEGEVACDEAALPVVTARLK